MSTKYTKSAFFSLLLPYALRLRQEGSPLFPSVRLAQNWLETGGTIHSWNNLGGYKVGSGITNSYWKGRSINASTWEEYNGVAVTTSAAFRAYDSIYDFYKDQDLLFAKSRYARVCAAITPEEQANTLQACGYATDSAYASKLIVIIHSNELTLYDKLGGGNDQLDLTTSQQKMLTNVFNDYAAKGIIEKSWADKAEKGTLTLSELAWLNTMITARKS